MTHLHSILFVVPLQAFLFALAAVTAFKLLTGHIVTRGLLVDPETGRTDPFRVQGLMAVLLVAVNYASELARASGAAFPAFNDSWLVLVGASNGLGFFPTARRKLVEFLRTR